MSWRRGVQGRGPELDCARLVAGEGQLPAVQEAEQAELTVPPVPPVGANCSS